MQILKETTKDWKCDYRVPCHTYVLDGIKAVAYIKEGTSEVIEFPKPMYFKKTGRTFKKVKI